MNVSDVKNEARQHKLMYKYFELSLSRPTNSQVAKTILSNEECDKVQSENNLYFVSRVRGAICTFLKKNKPDFKQYNSLEDNPKCECECECDYDCECYLNEFIMPAFKNLALSFEPYMNNGSLVNHILEEYTVEEKDRLSSCDLREILRLILYKELAYLAFDNGLYDVSCWHHEAAVLMYGGSIVSESFNPSDYIDENEVLSRNYKNIGARGGSQKGVNYSEPKQKALDYHDKYLSGKHSNGRFIYSGDKASRKILEHFDKIKDSLGYEPKPLAKHILAHRKQHFKD